MSGSVTHYDPFADLFVTPSPFPSWVKVVDDWEPLTSKVLASNYRV